MILLMAICCLASAVTGGVALSSGKTIEGIGCFVVTIILAICIFLKI